MKKPFSILFLVLSMLTIAGCPPWRGQPDGCQSGATRCNDAGVPQVCSPQRYWTNGDRPCGDLGQTCCLTQLRGAPLHACLPASACASE